MAEFLKKGNVFFLNKWNIRNIFRSEIRKTVRDFKAFSTVGRGCSVPLGDILSTLGDTQYLGGFIMQVGDIMSTVEVCSTMGEYNMLSFEYLHGTEHPHSTHDISPHVSLYPPQY